MKVEELEARIKTLENQVRTLQDIEDIKKLQRAYGYYLEHWMHQEIIDLFSDGPDVALMLSAGTYLGKEGVRRYFERFKELNPELLHQVMQLSGIVNVDSEGKTARGRWYGWGAFALPVGGGVKQLLITGIYVCEYIKEDGIWKIKTLRFDQIFAAPPAEGWVKPERVAAMDPQYTLRYIKADIPRTIDPRYPSGYIVPFHYKHPVTRKETSEGVRNSSIKEPGTD